MTDHQVITALYSRFKWRGGHAASPSLILLVMPYICYGGAERWAAAIVRQLHAEGRQIILVILGEKVGEASAARDWFFPHVKAIYYGDDEEGAPEVLLSHLAIKWNASVVMLVGQSSAYPALPKLRSLRGGLHIVSFQFNAVDLSEEHRQFAPYIDAVIVEGTDVADRIAGNGLSHGKIFHIPSAIRFPDPIQTKPGKKKNGRYQISFIGRMDVTSKDPLTFVEMAAHLQEDDLHFVMIGDGPEADGIQQLILERQDRVSMEFIRHVSDDLLTRHLAALDILVVPSRKDGRPLVIQEAQALGKPVVASRVGSIPELLLDGEAGILCEPANALEFAAAVRHLIQNPTVRQQLADAGYQRVCREGDILRIMPLLKNIIFSFP